MTCVARQPENRGLTFISDGLKLLCRQARLETQRPEEDAGRSVPPLRSGNLFFFGSELKSYSPAVAAGVSYRAFVGPRRRAHTQVNTKMQPDISDVSTPQAPTNSAPTDQEDISMEELNAKLESFRDGLQSAWSAIDELEEELEAEREERRRLEHENAELREEIERLDARTDLLSLVENSDKLSARQRRIALIQHLKKAAERERDRGRKAKASVNKAEAEAALQYPDLDRTTFYDDLRKAPGLVGNKNILWYESSSGGDSRLKLNLENGNLPSNIVGRRTRNGGE